MKELFAHLQLAAMTNLSVLLAGETGTGKEMAAKALHESGPRAKGPFTVFDCGATDPGLIGAALFGHKEGAYTGASGSRKGAFLTAHGGTLFLDEIGELPLEMQPKLLRALEQRQVQPLGSDQYVAFDTRIVCASHRDLEAMIVAGKFREDLYYRLAGLVLVMPPLRDRPVDVEPLARRFLQSARPDLSFSPEAMDRLTTYGWPGNVRELRNVIDRAAALCRNPVIMPTDLHLRITGRSPAAALAAAIAPVGTTVTGSTSGPAMSAAPASQGVEPRSGPAPIRSIKDAEIEAIQAALKATGGNKTEAAKILGIARKTLREKLEKYGLSGPGDGPGDAD
jgi:DNA-binding NtrC family response regulator